MKYIFGGFLLVAINSFAQSGQNLMGARQTAMGNASATLTDEWSLWHNVAGLAQTENRTLGASYEVTPSLVGANRMAFNGAAPLRLGVIGFGAFRFGDNVYSEQMISLAFAHKIGITSLGAKANVIQYRADGFGSQAALSLDFGGITQLTKQITIGEYLTNLTQSSFSASENYRLPTRLAVGLGFKLSDYVLATTELEKDLDYRAVWKTGIEYQAIKNFFIRGGFNFYPQNFYFGLGSKWGSVNANYAVRYNSLLGSTHQISISYHFAKTKER
ncbi:MAG: hypothetical protein ACK5R0_18890 [Bacteroidota bacterium]